MMLVPLPLPLTLALCALLPAAFAATATEWRNRTIYQLLTDRFVPSTADAPCNVEDIKYCGGTWSTLTERLDYIQSLGFSAIWISPTSSQINTSIYGEGYHGYWPVDHATLNPHFGNDASLLALSDAVHDRGMYLMVDVVLNHFASLSTNISTASLEEQSAEIGPLMFTQEENYHPPCEIDYDNQTSVLDCWFSLEGYVLMDVATETEAVQSKVWSWLGEFVQTYSVDGLRLDRQGGAFYTILVISVSEANDSGTLVPATVAKDMDDTFLIGACAAANVFCMGEVGTSDFSYSARFQNDGVLDSVLSYPMWYGLVDSFADGQSIEVVAYDMWQAQENYDDPSVLGTFIENHDQVRFRNMTQDDSLVYNALVASYMFEGIPIVYYGFEVDLAGGADPLNRPALWLYTDYTVPSDSSSTSQRLIKMNKLRRFLGDDFIAATSTREDSASLGALAMTRGEALAVINNRGESSTSAQWSITSNPFSAGDAVTDVLSCTNSTVSSDGSLSVTLQTGLPMVWLSAARATTGGFC